MILPNCEFRLVSTDGDTELVVCVNCGRPVRLFNASARYIVAGCRGEKETRWKCHDKPGSCAAGRELKAMLAGWPFRISASPDCPCTARAREMDVRGCDWCEANIDTIVGWLREQAEARGLPFLDAAGRLLVRRAIRNARRAAAS